jgi:hypothetical protein
MVPRRPAIAMTAIAVAVSVCFSAGLLAQKPVNKDDKKQDDQQKKEVQTIVKIADDAAADQPAQNDFALTWVREDVLKAQGNKEYIPFVVTIDPSKVSGGTLAFYWRVVSKGGAAPTVAAGDGKKDDKPSKDKDPKGKPDYPYEDVSFIPVAGQANGPMRITRSFTVPAGSYDVVVVAKEPASSQKGAPPPKLSVLKQTVTIPDFWNGELNTSTVIIAQRIDPLPAPLTPQQQADRPYALGQMEIVPQLDLMFSKKQELQTFMLIYNPKTNSANKPDVMVEYNFYAKQSGAEKFFNKTKPQNLNAETLPPQFDIAAGHQLQSGQAVPLASFPEGEYRLEIKVTDNVANKTLTRDVNFTVSAS